MNQILAQTHRGMVVLSAMTDKLPGGKQNEEWRDRESFRPDDDVEEMIVRILLRTKMDRTEIINRGLRRGLPVAVQEFIAEREKQLASARGLAESINEISSSTVAAAAQRLARKAVREISGHAAESDEPNPQTEKLAPSARRKT